MACCYFHLDSSVLLRACLIRGTVMDVPCEGVHLKRVWCSKAVSDDSLMRVWKGSEVIIYALHEFTIRGVSGKFQPVTSMIKLWYFIHAIICEKVCVVYRVCETWRYQRVLQLIFAGLNRVLKLVKGEENSVVCLHLWSYAQVNM